MRRVFLLAGIEQQRDEPGPAGLVRGAEAAARVAVEIFVEQQAVAKVGILPLPGRFAEIGAPPGAVFEEKFLQAAGQLQGDFFERQELSRSRRAFDAKVVAAFQRANRLQLPHVPNPSGQTIGA